MNKKLGLRALHRRFQLLKGDNSMKKKLPVIIVSCVLGAAILGGGVFTIVKTLGNKKSTEKDSKDEIEEMDPEEELQEEIESILDTEMETLDVKAYFEERSEIISVTSVKDSKHTMTEKEAVEEFETRGFAQYPVITEYSEDGKYSESVEVSKDSSKKHPKYETYFVNSKEEVWVITLIDGTVSATPAYYNMMHGGEVPVEVSETKEITSYDSTTNSVYLTIPKEEVLNVRIVDRVDANTLESMELEG